MCYAFDCGDLGRKSCLCIVLYLISFVKYTGQYCFCFFVGTFNAMYVGPKGGAEKEVPLIVFPHGGPHSAFGNYLFLECALFTSLGKCIIICFQVSVTNQFLRKNILENELKNPQILL